MRHLLVIWIFLSCTQICWTSFIDPTDLFNYDEMNRELSKKPAKRSDEQKPDESGEGIPEALETQPSTSNIEDGKGVLSNQSSDSQTEDYDNKVDRGEISTKQSLAPKIGDSGDDKVFQGPVLHCKEDIMTKTVFSLFQQFVMNFVQLSQGMIGESSHPVEFCMRIKATQHDLSVLRKFGQGESSAIHAAHEKLSTVFQSTCDLPDVSPTLWLQNRLGLSSTVLSLIVVSLLILFFIVKMLTSIRLTRSKIWFALIAVFITSVAFTWMEMYQKRVADQERVLTDSMHVRCPQYEKLNTWERFTHYLSAAVTFQEENCREFYEAMFINPVTQVSPLEAVAVAVVKTVVAPCKIIGEGIKDVIIGLFKDLPTQYAGFLMFLITIGAIGLLFTPLLAFGYTIKIPLLLSIEPTAKPKVIPIREVKKEKAIMANEEQGQGDRVQHWSIAPTSGSLNHQTQNKMVHASPSSISSNQSQVIRSQARALQKCKEEMKKKNDLSKGSQDTTPVDSLSSLQINSNKEPGKGSDSASHQETLLNERRESMPEDMNFVNLQHCDCEESYTELVSADFNTASEVQDSRDEDDDVHKTSDSEVENLNLNACKKNNDIRKNFEKDFNDLNIRDT